ncbi:MAG: VWA domain-containing protein, partial [Candidatus Altiarchaeota archaeon]|nr:VWA domain-containing protein [Candidatus Altiarchaeota archaeon]
ANIVYEGIIEGMKNATGFESVDLKEFSAGDRTGIGDALYQNSVGLSKESSLLILISDGNSNYGRDPGDVAKALRGTGVRIYSLTPELSADEVYIQGISGRKKIPANSDYRFTVDIVKLGGAAEYRLDLFIDDKKVNSTFIKQKKDIRSMGFTVSFKEEGIHKITAKIIPAEGDYLELNNRFTKTIDVVEKPSVLVVASQMDSPLIQLLKQNYYVTVTNNTINNLKEYSSVYLDNQNASTLSEMLDSLHEYVIDGNGLVFVGGDQAYEQGGYHENHRLEAILPVRSIEEPKEKRKPMAVVFLLDVSESLGISYVENGEELTYFDLSKANTINVIRQLDSEDSVAVLAFNIPVFEIANLTPLRGNRKQIEEMVLTLKASARGGTTILPALLSAERRLEDYSSDKYVILFTDGLQNRQLSSKDSIIKQAEFMAEKGIKVYTVGIGTPGSIYQGKEFMRGIASKGNGRYFGPETYERLKLEFEEKEERKDVERYQLDVYNRHHFITQDIKLPYTTITKYNIVNEKSIAQVLVTTKASKPVVTVWRFGLGRVVSITTDNGLRWSPYLYNSEEGKLISSITNWVIGDLEKKKRVRIETRDIPKGWEAEVIIRCDELPRLQRDNEEIPLKQVDINLYSGRFTPDETGFYILKALTPEAEDTDAVAVNYPTEFSRLGINSEELTEITKPGNGRTYNSTQIKQLRDDAIEYIKKGSLKRVKREKPLHIYLIAAALILYFIDVVIRRIKEIMRLRKE